MLPRVAILDLWSCPQETVCVEAITTATSLDTEDDSVTDGRVRALSSFEAGRAREVQPGASALLATALASQRSSDLELRFREAFVNIRTGSLFITYGILVGVPPVGADLAALILASSGESPQKYFRSRSPVFQRIHGRGQTMPLGATAEEGSPAQEGMAPTTTPMTLGQRRRAEGRGAQSQSSRQRACLEGPRGGHRGLGAEFVVDDPYEVTKDQMGTSEMGCGLPPRVQHWSMATDTEQELHRRTSPVLGTESHKGRRGETTSPSASRPSPYGRPSPSRPVRTTWPQSSRSPGLNRSRQPM